MDYFKLLKDLIQYYLCCKVLYHTPDYYKDIPETERPKVDSNNQLTNIQTLSKINFDHAFSIEELMSAHKKIHMIDQAIENLRHKVLELRYDKIPEDQKSKPLFAECDFCNKFRGEHN